MVSNIHELIILQPDEFAFREGAKWQCINCGKYFSVPPEDNCVPTVQWVKTEEQRYNQFHIKLTEIITKMHDLEDVLTKILARLNRSIF